MLKYFKLLLLLLFATPVYADGLVVPPPKIVLNQTWLPADSSGAGLTFIIDAARYSQVGNMVTATFHLIYPTTSDSSTVQIGSLPVPITSSITTNAYIIGQCYASFASNANVNLIAYVASPSATSFLISNNANVNILNSSMSALPLTCTLNYIGQ